MYDDDEYADETEAAMASMEYKREWKREAEANLAAQHARRDRLDDLVQATRWDPRQVGWNRPPSAEALITWIYELGRYRNVTLRERAVGGWSAFVERGGRRFRADYPSLPEACAAIDERTIWKSLRPDTADSRWAQSTDMMDVGYQGGAPGLGKRG